MRFLICFLSLFVTSIPALSAQQAATPVSSSDLPADPVLQSQGPKVVTLQGTAEVTHGKKHASGTVTLKTQADGSYSEDWQLPTGESSLQGGPQEMGRTCSITDSAGGAVALTEASCRKAVPWFAPWAGANFTAANMVSVGAQPKSSSNDLTGRTFLAVLPDLSGRNARYKRAVSEFRTASSVAIFYDPSTHFPAKLTYQVQNPNYSTTDVEIEYSDYRDEGGFMLPHHLVRSFQHTVELDLHISSATAE